MARVHPEKNGQTEIEKSHHEEEVHTKSQVSAAYDASGYRHEEYEQENHPNLFPQHRLSAVEAMNGSSRDFSYFSANQNTAMKITSAAAMT